MPNVSYELEDEIELYLDNGYAKTRLFWELIGNADRVINSVYIFKHFDEYCTQLLSDRQEDKKEVYWNASYYEKLVDYIKIVVAFETLNKAMLVRNGILIHKIDSKFHNKSLIRKQRDGVPITIEEFYENNYTNFDFLRRKAVLNGLTANFSTINFSHTLNENYQSILKQDSTLIFHLKDINQKRNRLHLYSDFKGAFRVDSHIKKWSFIKETSTMLIREELRKVDEELKRDFEKI